MVQDGIASTRTATSACYCWAEFCTICRAQKADWQQGCCESASAGVPFQDASQGKQWLCDWPWRQTRKCTRGGCLKKLPSADALLDLVLRYEQNPAWLMDYSISLSLGWSAVIYHAGDEETLWLIGSVVKKSWPCSFIDLFIYLFLSGGAAGCLIDSLSGWLGGTGDIGQHSWSDRATRQHEQGPRLCLPATHFHPHLHRHKLAGASRHSRQTHGFAVFLFLFLQNKTQISISVQLRFEGVLFANVASVCWNEWLVYFFLWLFKTFRNDFNNNNNNNNET